MKFESKYNEDDVVFVKTHLGVYMARVCSIGPDSTKMHAKKEEGREYRFVYTVWVSDRRDGAGHHETVFEGNMARTFEDAYFNSSTTFPWSIVVSKNRKDFVQHFGKSTLSTISTI